MPCLVGRELVHRVDIVSRVSGKARKENMHADVAGSPAIDRVMFAAVCVAATLVAALLWVRFAAHSDQLWTDLIHDRSAHLDFGVQAASDLRNLRLVGLLHDLNSFRSWPPLHDGVFVATAILLAGSDPRAAVLPSLLAFVGTAVLAFLITRRLAIRWRNLAGAFAASLVLVSPAMRAFATDVMIESTGTFFTLVVVYAAVRVRQAPTTPAWRFVAIALTALFFTKYNYWLIGFVGSIPTVWSRRHALRASALPRWTGWALRALVAGLIGIATWHGFLGGIAIGAATLAAMTATASIVIWSRTTGSRFLCDDDCARVLVRWHVVPVLAWFCIPGKFQGFLWFQSPFTNRGEAPKANPFAGIGYYASAATRDYHTSGVVAIVVVLLVLVASVGYFRKTLRPGAGLVLLFIAVALIATVPHPNRKSRFLEPSMPVVWVATGAGVTIVIDQVTRRRRWVVATIMLAVAGTQFPSAFANARAPEGGVQRRRPSAVALIDGYLPALAGASAPAILSNVPMRFLTRWTYQLAFDRSTRPVTEIPGYDAAKVTNDNSEALHRWLHSKAVDTLVFIDVTPSSPWFVVAPETEGLSALPGLLLVQVDFVEVEHHESNGAIVQIWRRKA